MCGFMNQDIFKVLNIFANAFKEADLRLPCLALIIGGGESCN